MLVGDIIILLAIKTSFPDTFLLSKHTSSKDVPKATEKALCTKPSTLCVTLASASSCKHQGLPFDICRGEACSGGDVILHRCAQDTSLPAT